MSNLKLKAAKEEKKVVSGKKAIFFSSKLNLLVELSNQLKPKNLTSTF